MDSSLEEKINSCLEQALWLVEKEIKTKPWLDVRHRFRDEAHKLVQEVLPKDKGFSKVFTNFEWRSELLDLHFFNDEELYVVKLARSEVRRRRISTNVVINFWRKLEKFQNYENRARKRRIFAYLCVNKSLSEPAYDKFKSLRKLGTISVHIVKPRQHSAILL